MLTVGALVSSWLIPVSAMGLAHSLRHCARLWAMSWRSPSHEVDASPHVCDSTNNTVAQTNHAIVISCSAYVVALGYFVSVDIMFLMVGHTHEDVEQFCLVVCEYCGRRRYVLVPMDAIEYLREALHERVARKGEEFKVSWVKFV